MQLQVLQFNVVVTVVTAAAFAGERNEVAHEFHAGDVERAVDGVVDGEPHVHFVVDVSFEVAFGVEVAEVLLG